MNEDKKCLNIVPIKLCYPLAWVFFFALFFPPVESFFRKSGLRWAYIFSFSLSLSFALTPIMKRIALRVRLLDFPSGSKAHHYPTPMLGGVAVYFAFTFSLLKNFILDPGMKAVLIGATVVFCFSLVDDIKRLSAVIRLVVQLLAVSLLIKYGVYLVLFPPYLWWGMVFNAILTYLWVIGIANAFNFLDGMDGLAAGLSGIVAFFLGMVAFETNQPYLGWLAVAALGSSVGFFPYNFKIKGDAEIFLGDSGSTFLGFILASIAVKGEWADNDPIVSLTAPLLIFAVMIYDMVHITISRIITGKVRSIGEWIAYVGRDHIHHRFEALFRSKKQSVLFIYLISISLGITALLLRSATTRDALTLLGQGVIILIVVTFLERAGNRLERRG
jgi:UDP-GlcNAc:undecaprenyl-phosphate GlcNAc-1-phosphate transferase